MLDFLLTKWLFGAALASKVNVVNSGSARLLLTPMVQNAEQGGEQGPPALYQI